MTVPRDEPGFQICTYRGQKFTWMLYEAGWSYGGPHRMTLEQATEMDGPLVPTEYIGSVREVLAEMKRLTDERDEARREVITLTHSESAALEGREHDLRVAVGERDDYHDMADGLAAEIARITGVQIGEHSAMNTPWANALEAARDCPPVAAMRPVVEAATAWHDESGDLPPADPLLRDIDCAVVAYREPRNG